MITDPSRAYKRLGVPAAVCIKSSKKSTPLHLPIPGSATVCSIMNNSGIYVELSKHGCVHYGIVVAI